MAAYARGCAAAQVDNLRDEYGGATRYKKGDRVRVVSEGDDEGGSYHEAKIGEVFTVDGVFDDVVHTNEWYFYPHEIEPVETPLQLEAGKYYRTRDGRKVGPMRNEGWPDGEPWTANNTERYYTAEGSRVEPLGEPDDLIAEWVDEPKSTKEILDDLEAWMAEQDASRDSTPTPTTGFTVPICAYGPADIELTDEGRQVAESYKQGYEDGYQRGRSEGADKPITVNVAVTLAETVDIPDRVAARVREALRTYYGKAA